jgi:SAM-dependent methyltransferase
MEKLENSDPVYNDGRHYDAQQKDFAVDIPFYLEQSVNYGDPILELACGTGRVSIPIAKSGFDVTGIDISSGMLNSAAVDAAEAGAKINFIKGDIRNFKIDKKFNLIIFPFNSLAHLLDLESVNGCFQSVREHLLPDGRFILDFMNPDFKYFMRDQSVSYPVDTYPDPDSDEMVIITENNFYDRATQINHIKWHYKIGEKEFTYDWSMRMYYPQELQALLIENGFNIEHKFGSFDCAEFATDSAKQIYVCSVKG